MSITMARKRQRPEEWIYDEKKFPRQFMLTQTASDTIDEIAEGMNLSRSEVIERAIRCGGLKAAKNFDYRTGECRNQEK